MWESLEFIARLGFALAAFGNLYLSYRADKGGNEVLGVVRLSLGGILVLLATS